MHQSPLRKLVIIKINLAAVDGIKVAEALALVLAPA